MAFKLLSVEVLSAVLYGLCSGSMNFLNKFLLTTWGFKQPAVIMLVQLVINVLIIKVLKILNKVKVRPYDYHAAKSCAFLSTLYSSNTILALFALTGMNVPMYIALRRCIPFASMVLGYIFFLKRPTVYIFTSIVVITVGTFIATSGDLTFSIHPYALGIVSVIFMALHLLVLKQSSVEKEYSTLDLIYINSFNCIPLLLILALINFSEVLSYAHLYEVQFLLSFLLVAVMGCLFNYSLFLCTTANSALTTSWVGVVKSGFTTVIGMFAFGGVQPTPLLLSGLTINFTGCIMYAYAKFLQNKADDLANLTEKEEQTLQPVNGSV